MTTVIYSNITYDNNGSEAVRRAGVTFGLWDNDSVPVIYAKDLGLSQIHKITVTGGNTGNFGFAYSLASDKSYAQLVALDPFLKASDATFTVVANATPVGNPVQIGVNAYGAILRADNAVSSSDGNIFIENSDGIKDVVVIEDSNGSSGEQINVTNGGKLSCDFSGLGIINPPNSRVVIYTSINKWGIALNNEVSGTALYWNDTDNQLEADLDDDVEVSLLDGLVANSTNINGLGLTIEVVGY